MDILEKEILDKMTEKRDNLVNILTYTEKLKFAGRDDDADRFVNLYEKRAEIFSSINEIDGFLNTEQCTRLMDEGTVEFRREAELLKNSITSAATKIIQLDKQNAEMAPVIIERIKKNMRSINEGKSINLLYNDDIGLYDGYSFDQKK